MIKRQMNRSSKCLTALIAGAVMAAAIIVSNGLGFYDEASVVSAYDIPAPDVTYTGACNPIVITQNITIKLDGVTINGGSNYSSGIMIEDNSTVNIVLSGENTVSGASNVISAGIMVQSGSSVNIYGLDGSTLTVTGGRYGAGIGGMGYDSASPANLPAGNINIYSGTIIATGGDRSAGIGSGYHQSAGDINIYGGDITAVGTTCGAGIGSGYGTSGGAEAASMVGYYNGGNITISGGNIIATAGITDTGNIDIYDVDSFSINNNFAAGIGGGYGASSGNIIIEGDAVVLAIGQCGGAGIGTGRGTSTGYKYDADNADFNIIIRGNAKVTALSGKDDRAGQTSHSGAAIGGGRGFGLENGSIGYIEISGNAEVFAHAGSNADGIGVGIAVYRFNNGMEDDLRYADSDVRIASSCRVMSYENGQLVFSQTGIPGETGTYIDSLIDSLDLAIALGGEQTVYWSEGDALPYFVLKILEEHPDITLVFSYTYNDVDYVLTIHGSDVTAEITIPWYGPMNLYGTYGLTQQAS